MLNETALEIPEHLYREMVAHCLREFPLECCGILGGISPQVSSIHPLRNVAASETRYDADPREILDAVRQLRERGAAFLAIYHSHPRAEAFPSRVDLEQNYYGDLPRIIVSLLREPPDVRVWRLDSDSYRELPYVRTPSPDEATPRTAD